MGNFFFLGDIELIFQKDCFKNYNSFLILFQSEERRRTVTEGRWNLIIILTESFAEHPMHVANLLCHTFSVNKKLHWKDHLKVRVRIHINKDIFDQSAKFYLYCVQSGIRIWVSLFTDLVQGDSRCVMNDRKILNEMYYFEFIQNKE